MFAERTSFTTDHPKPFPPDRMLDASVVDRIVQNVLSQLGAPGRGLSTGSSAARPLTAPAPDKTVPGAVASPAVPGPSTAAPTRIDDRVITADLLAEKLGGGRQLLISPKAILTPSAHDYIKDHRVELRREATAGPAASRAASRNKLLVVRATPSVEKLRGELSWPTELLSCPDEASTLAISAIARGESDFVVILAAQHHRAACRANRHEKVRAAALTDAASAIAAREQMRLNVIALNPTGKTFFELSHILKAALAGPLK